MKLYFSNGSPFARKVRIVLAEKALAFESDVNDGLRPADVANPPLAPWLARQDFHWEDMTTLATIASCAASIVNLRLMLPDGITPANSDYLARQKTRVEHCLDWLEGKVTSEGFAPGWFSIMDIAFICPMVYCETRGVMPWRGRPKREALHERHQTRPSLLATPINILPPLVPRYTIERKAAT